MVTATDVFPVLALVLLAVLVALPGSRQRPQDRIPQQRPGDLDPHEPLPPDRRAHLSWLADHSEQAGTRRRALELLAVDDRRRGLDQLRRVR